MRLHRSRPFMHNAVVHRVAFIPYLCAGDPSLDVTKQALVALCEEGADIIELGIPYSVRRRSR